MDFKMSDFAKDGTGASAKELVATIISSLDDEHRAEYLTKILDFTKISPEEVNKLAAGIIEYEEQRLSSLTDGQKEEFLYKLHQKGDLDAYNLYSYIFSERLNQSGTRK